MPRKGPDDKPVQLSYGGDFSGSGKWVWASSLDENGNPLPGFDARRDALTQDEVNAEGLTNAGNAGNFFDDIGEAIGFNPKEITADAPGGALQTGGDGGADDQRARQQEWVMQMQQQAATGDGAWQQSFAQAVQASKAATQSLGQSDARQDSGGALYDIGQAQGAVDARAAGEEGMLREQAKLDARGQLADQLGGMAQADIGQDVEEARIQRERRAANQSLIDQSGKNRENVQKSITGAFSGGAGMSEGGKVPGRAQVFGDDTRNDTVPAMLSPGEIVIPREVVQQSPDAAARFVAAVKAQGGAEGRAGGGETGIKRGSADELARRGGYWGYAISPDVGRTVQYKAMQGMMDANDGGTIDDSRYQQTAQAQTDLASLFAGQAVGSGPSIVPMLNARATDETMGAGMAAQGRAPAGEVLKGAAASGASAAGDAGRQRATEQSRGQQAFADAIKQRRGQELQLASAKQQAGWQKTMADVGLSLKQQAEIRNSLAGAGQAATAFASQGGDNQGSNLKMLSDNPYPENYGGSDPGEWKDPYEDEQGSGLKGGMAYGGVVGMASGGRVVKSGEVDAEYTMKALKAEHDRLNTKPTSEHTMERMRAEAEKQGAEWAKPKGKDSKDSESRFVRAVREAARKAGGAVTGMSEGGPVPYQSYDPGALPPRADSGPVMVDMQGRPLQTLSPEEQALRIKEQTAFKAGELQSKNEAESARRASLDLSDPGQYGRELERKAETRAALTTLRPRSEPDASTAPPPAPVPEVKTKPAGVGMSSRPSGAAADEMSRKAALAQYEADNRAVVASSEAAAAEANAHETQANERKALVERTRADVTAARTRYQQAADEAARIDTTVDPGRFWATRSTGDKIVLTLGLIMGAMGASSDGVNRAANILNDAVNRDLEAQKAEHEMRLKKGGAKVAAAQNFYAMAREIAGDEVSAMDIAHGMALQSVIAKGKSLIAQTKDAQAQAQLAAAIAQVEQGKLARENAGFDKSADRWLEARKAEMAAGGRTRPDAAAAMKDAREADASYREMKGTVDQLKSLIGDTNIVTESVGGRSAKMETLAASLLTKIKQSEQLGALDRGTTELAAKLIGDPTATFTQDSTKIAKLDALLEQARQKAAITRAEAQ